jgi:hypothetical protein
MPAASSTPSEGATRRHGRQQATTLDGGPLRQPQGSLTNAEAPGDPCVQPRDPHDELPSALSPAHLDRQLHGGDGPSCMAQRQSPGVLTRRCHH